MERSLKRANEETLQYKQKVQALNQEIVDLLDIDPQSINDDQAVYLALKKTVNQRNKLFREERKPQ